MSIVQLEHVRKVYDKKVAVEDLSFSIEPGTMFGLTLALSGFSASHSSAML